jgi:hypothetical protein
VGVRCSMGHNRPVALDRPEGIGTFFYSNNF